MFFNSPAEMIMKICTLLLTLLLLFDSAIAQKQTSNWIFGNGHHVSFATGSPVVLPNVPLKSDEGSATISDINGNLLFYTNGSVVWNKQHHQMPNGAGLIGGVSSVQCAVIVPYPKKENLYFLFTAADLTNFSKKQVGFHYSLINMEMDGGLGDIEQKNITLLDSNTSEAVSATTDCTGKGFWVLTHDSKKDVFYSYHVTTEGIDTTPVISTNFSDKPEDFIVSQIKISPDSRTIALTDASRAPLLSIYDFDNKTGKVTNRRVLMDETFWGCYSAAFSPDNSKLYVTRSDFTNPDDKLTLVRFSLGFPTPEEIKATAMYYERPGDLTNLGALQLAPDGKIYITEFEFGETFLGVINNPDNIGAYQRKAVPLGGTDPVNGLANFADSYLQANPQYACAVVTSNFTTSVICEKNSMIYTNISENGEEWHWEFGGGIPATFSGRNPPPVYYENAGVYTTTLTVKSDTDSDILQRSIEVLKPPALVLTAENNSKVCRGESIRLSAKTDQGKVRFEWRTTSSGLSNYDSPEPIATPLENTIYYVKATNEGGCSYEDSILVTVVEHPTVKASSELQKICSIGSVRLKAESSGNVRFQWRESDAGLDNYLSAEPLATPSKTTTYHVTVINAEGCTAQDSVTIIVYPSEYISSPIGISDAVLPGKETFGFIHILVENPVKGVTSFKTRLRYDKTFFRYNTGSQQATKGMDFTWNIQVQEILPGELLIEAAGATPLVDASIQVNFETFMGTPGDSLFTVKLIEVDGQDENSQPECRVINWNETKRTFVPGDVCGGAIRYVNLSPFQTFLEATVPNPVEDESEINYSLSFDGKVDIHIFNHQGELLKTLVSGIKTAG
ncbi:MAG TPA: hypothetical protein VEC36_00645, partial [Patescibacteria group bacterium]|nr:hypothetical protein [Patescibacteria group bacterium]